MLVLLAGLGRALPNAFGAGGFASAGWTTVGRGSPQLPHGRGRSAGRSARSPSRAGHARPGSPDPPPGITVQGGRHRRPAWPLLKRRNSGPAWRLATACQASKAPGYSGSSPLRRQVVTFV